MSNRNLEPFTRWRRFVLTLGIVAALAGTAGAAAGPGDQIFATVDTRIITVGEFSRALVEGVRKKYYHGKIPESEQATFQHDVANALINRILLLNEAKRLDLAPDGAWVQVRLDTLDQKARKHAQWAAHREQMLALARERLEQDSVLKLLEARVREQAPATESQLQSFYEQNPQRFTEPERFRVSAILLRVQPSSPSAVWEAAEKEALGLVNKIRGGTSFAELARLHSSDVSAEKGGDMGYLHRGMLGEPAQKAVDALAVGEVTDPVTLLEGVAIFRLEDRPAPRRRGFEEVRTRAAALWIRDRSEQAWEEYRKALRAKAEIQIEDQHLLQPLSNAPSTQ